MKVAMSIQNRDDWLDLFNKLIDLGLLSDITQEDIDLDEDQFPVEFFIDIDPILNVISNNPMIRPFKKKLNTSLTNAVTSLIGG
jgi:hypothetical protein